MISNYGNVKNIQTNKNIVGDINNAGYLRVSLYYKGKAKHFFRHRLVAEHFLPNPQCYSEINHIDGNKSNNCVSNLEWVSRQLNERKSQVDSIKKL